MDNFCLKFLDKDNINSELKNIGFDENYIDIASNKYKYVNIKIFKLSIPQANILKQTALSVGADCAVNKDVLTNQVEHSDCILGGSFSQIKQIINKLKFQPFSMSVLSENLEIFIKEKEYNLPKIVGILNLTKDSFSDGGLYFNFEDALKHLNELIEDGADIIDIGAESTKPYSKPIESKEQLERIEPILKYISENNLNIPISIDTRSSEVAKKACDFGISIINDVSGLEYDKDMINVVSNAGVKIVIQHSLSSPEDMQYKPVYNNLVDDIYVNLYNKVKYAQSVGVEKEDIIIDVGICFGKTKEQNFELIKRIKEFNSIGCEVMLGISRKSFLGMENLSNEEKDIYTLALNTLIIDHQVDYIRVHNVKMHKKLIELMKIFKDL